MTSKQEQAIKQIISRIRQKVQNFETVDETDSIEITFSKHCEYKTLDSTEPYTLREDEKIYKFQVEIDTCIRDVTEKSFKIIDDLNEYFDAVDYDIYVVVKSNSSNFMHEGLRPGALTNGA